MFISFLLGTLSFCAFYYLSKTRIADTALYKLTVAAVCVFVTAYTFIEFAKFTVKRILFFTPRFAIALLFAGIIAVFCFASEKALIKFCLLFSLIAVLFCSLIILASSFNFEFSNFDCLPGVDVREITKNYLIIFMPLFIPSVKRKPSFLSGLYGIGAASFLIIVFSLLTVCTFGELNDMLDYPVLALSDTVNSGRIFTRLGLYLDAVIYVSGLIRCVFSLKTAKLILTANNN